MKHSLVQDGTNIKLERGAHGTLLWYVLSGTRSLVQFVGHQLALRRCQPERIWKTAILDNRPNIIKCPVSTSCCARLKRCATLRNTSNLCNVLGSFGSVPGRQHKSYLDSCEKTFKWFGTHQLLSFVFLWARTSCIHCSNNHHLWTSCIYCSNKLSSIGTHHLDPFGGSSSHLPSKVLS